MLGGGIDNLEEITPMFEDFSPAGELWIRFEPPDANVPETWAALWDDSKKALLTEEELRNYEAAISRVLQVLFVQNSEEALQSSFYNTD